jgi:hypothetical protein
MGKFCAAANRSGALPRAEAYSSMHIFGPEERRQILRISRKLFALLALVVSPVAAQSVTLTPASENFGSVAVGSSGAAKTFTLKNSLKIAATISSVATSGDFKVTTNNCPSSLGASKTCTILVVFQPTATGSRAGSLTVTDSAPNGSQSASFTGTGTDPVTIVPSTLAFGDLGVGATSAPKIVTFTNTPTTQVTITAISTNSPFQIQSKTCPLSPMSLSGDSSCTVSVIFLPTSAGASGGKLTFTDTGAASPQSVSLTGTGVALKSITVSPTSPTIPKGATQSFTATGHYSGGSTQNITNSVAWTASPVGIAAISDSIGSQGVATGLNEGKSNIAATFSGLTGSATLNVGLPNLVSIAVTPANPSIALGTSQQLVATGTYTDGSTQTLTAGVTWTSAASNVATVSNQGLVTSSSLGSANMTAALGSVSGSTLVTVTPAALVSIAVTPAIPSIPLGTTQQFTATGTYTDQSNQNISTSVQWTSSNPTIATISNAAGTQGLATSAGSGSSLITATSGSLSGGTMLSVTATLTSLTVSPANSLLALGTTEQLSASGTFTDGTTQDLTNSVTWTSSDTEIANISSAGLATGLMTGPATISASSASISGTATVTVSPAVLLSISVSPPNASIALNSSQQFTATGAYSDGSSQDLSAEVSWASSSAVVATISDSVPTMGLATGITAGTTIITATSGAITGSASLTVTPAALVAITVAPQNPSIPLGTSQAFTASGMFSDGTTQDVTTSVTWFSDTATVAVISNVPGNQGLSTSAGVGTANISASLSSISGTTALTVTGPQLVSISISPANPVVTLGAPQQFTALGTFTDNSTQDETSSAIWGSSNTSIAGIAASGLATTAGVGATTISATVGGVSSSTNLSVTSATGGPALVSIIVAPAAPTIPAGTTIQFTATGIYSDGTMQSLTNSVTWNSSNSSLAVISNAVGSQGSASGSAQGAATITATLGSISGSAALTIGAPVLTSISISPTSASLMIGGTQQFFAIGTFTDNSTSDVTPLSTWTSSSTASITIQSAGQTNPGLASALTLSPSLTVSATYQGQIANAIVTVNTAMVPINDLGANFYLGLYQGGFYPGGSNTEPPQHASDGVTFGNQIQSLDINGNPNSNGAIVVIGAGMSVALAEFSSFAKLANTSPALAPGVVLLDEAVSNNDACTWITGAVGVQPTCCLVPGSQCAANQLGNPPANQFDRICGNLSGNGRNCNQVQVVWIDTANGSDHPYMWGCFTGGSGAETVYVPCNSLDPNSTSNNSYQLTDALNLEWELGQQIRASKFRFPNLKQVFLSSRAYAGYCVSNCANPEPKAYEVGFAVQWLIQAQINQCPTSACTGPIDPIAGDMGYTNAAWVDWSFDTTVIGMSQAYLWANGDSPRSDGLVWCHGSLLTQAAPCNADEDFTGPDWLHLSTTGGTKAGQLIFNFFLNSTYTSGWFAAP